MGTFYEAIKYFSASDQSVIYARLHEWGQTYLGEYVCNNLKLDHFMPLNTMIEILKFIVDKKLLNNDDFGAAFEKECYKHVLKGGRIYPKGKLPVIFGAAIDRSVFDKHLMTNYKNIFKSKQERRDFIDKLTINSKLPGSRHSGYINIKLKAYSVWATWNMSDFKAHPFNFCATNDADEIRANMGLLKASRNEELLLFLYTIPPEIEPQRPTIADAGLGQHFQPALPLDEDHGWTINWRLENKTKGYNLGKRPECVHKSIELKSVKLPIEIK